MFAAAEWERDVPQHTADFPKVHKKKKPKLKNKVCHVLAPVTGNPEPKLNKMNLKRKRSLSNAISKSANSADNKSNKPKTKKRKENKMEVKNGVVYNDLEKLDETIIANKKQEIFNTIKPKEVETMLFGNNTMDKDEIINTMDKEKLNNNKNKKKINNTVDKKKMNNAMDMKTFINSMDKKKINNCIDMKKINNTMDKKKMNNTMDKNKLNNSMDKKNINNTMGKMKMNNTMDKEKMNNAMDKKKKKKEKYIKILDTHLNRTIQRSGASLRQRMTETLKSAQFRYLNEKLYLSEGKDAKELFKNDPAAFEIYHNGFRQQMKKWPINPLEVIIKEIEKMPKETKVADMGCGEAELARRVPQRVRSFDLVAGAGSAGVEECDMAHTPLLTGEMDVAVYCLALMGTNLKEYLVEANRILRVGGTMKIAEVESRFKDLNEFIRSVESYGFKLVRVDDSKNVFYFMDFKKQRDLGSKKGKLPHITLEPCLYKKR